nr:formyltransferase family protein [uncultured Draconibacterium sp.]
MRVGIISDSDALIPLVYTLAGQQSLQVYLYYSPSSDPFVNKKVLEFARQTRIPMTEERNKDRDLYPWLNKGKYDVCFVIGYKYRIRLERLVCQTPLFNIHFGSLPAFKGPTPVFWQLKYGAEKIGLCIHYLTEKLDSGDVVWLKEIENREHYNCKQVSQLFSQLCIEGVLLIIHFIMKGISLPVIDRGAFKNAYQKRPALVDVKIDWQQMGAVEICNLVRACNPWNKGAITSYKGQDVKLMDARIILSKEDVGCEAGTIVRNNGELHIRCKDKQTLKVNTLFFQESYIPSYQAALAGLKKGNLFT